MADPRAAEEMDAPPTWFRDRWRHRPDPRPGQGILYWHMLVGGLPAVTSLARRARQQLASFSGFHFTPLKWLHITALADGPADQIPPGGLQHMIHVASQLLHEAEPAPVTIGRLLYHPEGIMLAVEPGRCPGADPRRGTSRDQYHHGAGRQR